MQLISEDIVWRSVENLPYIHRKLINILQTYNFIRESTNLKHFTHLLLALCLAFLQGIESVQVATASAIQKAFAFILLGMISEHIKASEAPDSIGAIGSRGQATILCGDIRKYWTALRSIKYFYLLCFRPNDKPNSAKSRHTTATNFILGFNS